MSAALRAVTRSPMTASSALAWFAGSSAPDTSIGFAYAVREAVWFRLEDGVPVGPDGRLDLGEAYEMFCFDGDRELRWVCDTAAEGPAVILAEQGVDLPDGADVNTWLLGDGTPVATEAQRFREQSHRLAGWLSPDRDGWSSLGNSQYGKGVLPVTCPADNPRDYVLTLDSVEYLATDEYGNAGIAETRLSGLTLRDRASEGESRT